MGSLWISCETWGIGPHIASGALLHGVTMTAAPARPLTRTAPDTHDTVRFGVFPSSLGAMLVAGTSRGVCHVALGDDASALEQALRTSFSEAPVIADASHVTLWARTIEAKANGRDHSGDVPLDAPGTPFQERVWSELRRIPRGQHRSYLELAAAIGQPTAARAVARACATNRVAVLIPCHRVVRGTGTLGGYRWGVARKQALLDAERVDLPAPASKG
jgi:AraC family transcriptional regulator of adaptative response/methylated-DNA-[protein]-cysteine methyltransferase